MVDFVSKKVLFYLSAIAFHLILLFTDMGNYFHGGTVAELVALQAMAVLLVATALTLLRKVGLIEKVFVVLCAIVPAISVIWSLVLVIGR